MMRRSQEAQAYAQERQAQALEGTQAALLALVQMLRPALKDLRKFLQQSGTEAAHSSGAATTGATTTSTTTTTTAAAAAAAEGSGAEEQPRPKSPVPPEPTEETQ